MLLCVLCSVYVVTIALHSIDKSTRFILEKDSSPCIYAIIFGNTTLNESNQLPIIDMYAKTK